MKKISLLSKLKIINIKNILTVLIFSISCFLNIYLYAKTLDVYHVFSPGDPISSSQVNHNFKIIIDKLNEHDAILNSGNPPVGTVIAFAGESDSVPPGWLLCDGSLVDKNNYEKLFSIIGTKWGGDGFPNFMLPDLRGRFLRGVDLNSGRDVDASQRTNSDRTAILGDNVGSYQGDAFQSHWHNFYHTRKDIPSSGGEKNTVGTGFNRTDIVGKPIWDNDINNPQPKLSTETRPKNGAVNFIIKY